MVTIRVLRKRDREDFDKFGNAQIGIGDFVSNQIAESFRDYLKRFYLSGQALGVVTGKTRDSTNIFRYRKRKGQWAVRPGVGIRGSLNYLKIFERGGGEIVAKRGEDPFLYFEIGGQLFRKRIVQMPGYPFVSPAFQNFKSSGESRKIMLRIYQAMRKKLLPEAGEAK